MSSDDIEGSEHEPQADPDQAAPVEEAGEDTPTEAAASDDDDAPSADAEASPTAADDPYRPQPEVDLARTLLHQSVAEDDRPGRRWCYGGLMQLIATVFILYHGVILLVHNLPSKGLANGVQKLFNEKLQANKYWRATGNSQSWAMFAPNPHRSNIFMKVLVEDQSGEVWDLKHDIYGKRTYPYLWYDRMGKINRRIVDQKGYRRHYAAWVCRQWEKDHDGEPAVEVRFIKMWTRIPPPQAVWKRAEGNFFKLGYDPMDLHLHEREEDTIRCRTTRQAQLPNYLRERYGLPSMPDNYFLENHNRTWWDLAESKRKAEERKNDRPHRRSSRRGGAK